VDFSVLFYCLVLYSAMHIVKAH